MKRFFIKRITVSSDRKKDSNIEFKDGLNIIVGPSNTGKSYVIKCINFIFGGSDCPFGKLETGYNTVCMTLENEDNDYINIERKIVDGKNGEKGDSNVKITSSILEYNNKKLNKNGYTDFLLSLLGIKKPHKVISDEDTYKTKNLTLRSLFHLFYLDEQNIFESSSPFYSPKFKTVTYTLMGLLFIITGNDYNELIPKYTKEEIEKRKNQKIGVINYLKNKQNELNNNKIELENRIKSLENINIEEKINSIADEIELIESEIISISNKDREIIKRKSEIALQLNEAKILNEQYAKLHSLYESDIKRLLFIIDGEEKKKANKTLSKCPLCNNNIEDTEKGPLKGAATVELERVKIQLQDLKEAEIDLKNEIKEIENQIKEINEEHNSFIALINRELKPKSQELKKALNSYLSFSNMNSDLQALIDIIKTINNELIEKDTETEESLLPFKAKNMIDSEIWKKLNENFEQMVIECNYPGNPIARISIDTMDAVVNNKAKKDEGKGYRAFLNTIMLFNLMKFLEINGKYPFRFLFLDSPILSLKENSLEMSEEEQTTGGMREALFRYMVNNCGENQVIIAENEIPQNVDYTNANLIEFTKNKEKGRYGFFESYYK